MKHPTINRYLLGTDFMPGFALNVTSQFQNPDIFMVLSTALKQTGAFKSRNSTATM